MQQELKHLVKKYPDLDECTSDITRVFELMKESYHRGGKLLLCGNGGSAADCEHIVGELMKGFTLQRQVDDSFKQRLINEDPSEGAYMAEHLQQALPAISLVSHSALMTAFANDVGADMVFAQQVYGYGRSGDVVMGLSTSGNSNNVVKALNVANAMGLKTVGFTGESGGVMKDVCDITVQVPWQETPDIQERHLPIYHALCIMLEKEFFSIMTVLAGLDIGGTKCAVSIGELNEYGIDIKGKTRFLTPDSPHKAIAQMTDALDQLLEEHGISSPHAIGISCGGPLNSRQGVILSPPNLPGWDHIEIVSLLKERYDIPVALQNDANAGALAEWRWGAGKGCENMIFLTFGTGMGAGLILNGHLYSGTNDLAGEVGHVRLAEDGPVGFGKAGSFEGFCSGGGIAKLAAAMAERAIEAGSPPAFCSTLDQLDDITTKKVGEAAQAGDSLALQVYSIVGNRLGRGLAMLIDILNPEKVVIGSIYGRQQQILEPIVLKELEKEAIDLSLSVCEIKPAGLGERIGDLASVSVAMHAIEQEE